MMDFINFWGCNPGKWFLCSMQKVVNKTEEGNCCRSSASFKLFLVLHLQNSPEEGIWDSARISSPSWSYDFATVGVTVIKNLLFLGTQKLDVFLQEIMYSFMNWGSFHAENVALHLCFLLLSGSHLPRSNTSWYDSFRSSNLAEIVSCLRYLWTAFLSAFTYLSIQL